MGNNGNVGIKYLTLYELDGGTEKCNFVWECHINYATYYASFMHDEFVI